MRYLPLLCLLLIIASRSTANDKYLYIHEPGAKHLYFFFPMPSHHFMQLPAGAFSKAGGLGVGIGASYTYANNRFASLTAGVATYMPLVAFAERGRIDEYHWNERAATISVSLRDNRVINKITAGYGISFNHFNHSASYYNTELGKDSLQQEYSDAGLGLSFSARYQFRHFLSAGCFYQPQVYSFQRGFGYQHVLGMEMILTLPLSRRAGWVRPGKDN